MTLDPEARGEALAHKFKMDEVLNGSTPERRKAAFVQAMTAAWSDGWDACTEEHRAVLTGLADKPA